MPICIPESPLHKSRSEQLVWEKLRSDLPDEAWLLTNFAFSDDRRDYEIDNIIINPGVGITVVEVKGGQLEQDENGWWRQYSGDHVPRAVNPARQAQDATYAVLNFLKGRGFERDGHFTWMVVLPFTQLPDGFDSIQMPRSRVIDQTQMQTLAEDIERFTMRGVRRSPDLLICGEVATLLTGMRDPQQRWREDKLRRELVVRHWTEDQYQVLDQLRRNRRFMVLGPAGSGKTFVALEQARRLTAAGNDVAVLCYSVGLARYLQSVVATWPELDQPKYVGTYSALAHRWGIPIPPDAAQTWWREELPVLAAKAATELPDDQRFDAIIVDEAQDLSESWWTALQASYREDGAKGLYAFGDFDQILFGDSPLSELDLPEFLLEENLRNSGPIAEAASGLATEPFKHRAITGPAVQFVRCDPADAHHAADSTVVELLNENWQHEDIALLTTNHRHNEHKSAVERSRVGYWDGFWDKDEVFYSHVTSFKGLERAVVVIALDGWKEPEAKRQYLYTAMSRARDLLVICGSESDIEAAGGEALLDQLQLRGEYVEEPDESDEDPLGYVPEEPELV